MLGPHPGITILFIGVVLVVVYFLELFSRSKPWTDKERIETAAKIHSTSAGFLLWIKMALKGQSVGVWCLFVSAYATESGSARVEINKKEIREEFEKYYSQRNDEYVAPKWLAMFVENTIDPPSLRKKSQQQKEEEREQEEMWQRYKNGIKTDNEHRDLAIKLLEEE